MTGDSTITDLEDGRIGLRAGVRPAGGTICPPYFRLTRTPSRAGHSQREFVTTRATAHADVPGDWLQITVARTGHGSAGDCALAPQTHEARTVEIGFTIAPEHQGRGYAREARLIAPAPPVRSARQSPRNGFLRSRNPPSVRVLEVVGMRLPRRLIHDLRSPVRYARGTRAAQATGRCPRTRPRRTNRDGRRGRARFRPGNDVYAETTTGSFPELPASPSACSPPSPST